MAHRTSGVGGPGPHTSVWRQLGGGGGLRLRGLAEFGRAERRPTLVAGAARMGEDSGRASDGCGVSAGTVRETRSTVGAAFDGRLPLRLGRISTAEPLADCVSTFFGSVLESAAAPASSDRRGWCCCKSTGSCGCLSTVEGVWRSSSVMRISSSVMCLYCGGGSSSMRGASSWSCRWVERRAYLALVLTVRRPALHLLPDLWPLRWRLGGLSVRFQLCPWAS